MKNQTNQQMINEKRCTLPAFRCCCNMEKVNDVHWERWREPKQKTVNTKKKLKEKKTNKVYIINIIIIIIYMYILTNILYIYDHRVQLAKERGTSGCLARRRERSPPLAMPRRQASVTKRSLFRISDDIRLSVGTQNHWRECCFVIGDVKSGKNWVRVWKNRGKLAPSSSCLLSWIRLEMFSEVLNISNQPFWFIYRFWW